MKKTVFPKTAALALAFIVNLPLAAATTSEVVPKDYSWTTESRDASESMPVGGGSIGMNAWVEDGQLRFYVSRSGSFDENNTILKQGRWRIVLPKTDGEFCQTLHLGEGYLTVRQGTVTTTIWADVSKPVVHLSIDSPTPIDAEVVYENWRYADHPCRGDELEQTSFKRTGLTDVLTRRDSITADARTVTFYHRNQSSPLDAFHRTVSQQGLGDVADKQYNPLANLTFGGRMTVSRNMAFAGTADGTYADADFHGWHFKSQSPGRHFQLTIALAELQGSEAEWLARLAQTEASISVKKDQQQSRRWWRQFWQRSWIEASGNDDAAQVSRNYTLFRYMLACNAYGDWPTKFNGGLLTFDPALVDEKKAFSPDYRRWGGGTHTAQNQRLLYWPMLKSGDWDMMTPQLEFYRRNLRNAELRSETYWNHAGACFTEQLENFGLPQYFEWGTKRPKEFDRGVQWNAWLEYTWDTVLEFCQMAFEREEYGGESAEPYVALAQSVLDFFDNHYRYLARCRSMKELDDDGHLVIYPGSAAETFKVAYNPTSTILALRTVCQSLLHYAEGKPQYAELARRDSAFLRTIPDISFRYQLVDGVETKLIAPAAAWARVNNSEPMSMYAVYPWRAYGVGRPDLQVALDTWRHDPWVKQFAAHQSWTQYPIFAACLGLPDDAAYWIKRKLKDGPHRFPAFWGPGYDWTPDHNWGGSGMIALQEMLLQEVGNRLLLLQAWPADWDVCFRLHAKGNTVVEATVKSGKLTHLTVTPKSRERDVEIPTQFK